MQPWNPWNGIVGFYRAKVQRTDLGERSASQLWGHTVIAIGLEADRTDSRS